MNIIFIETPEFIEKIDKLSIPKEFSALQDELIANPYKGKIEKGSGGARLIYYYVNLRGEIWFLNTYLKRQD